MVTKLCDFCNTPDPITTLTFKEVVQEASTEDGDKIRQELDADWMTCEVCLRYILTADFKGLIDRVMIVGKHPAYIRPGLEGLYSVLFDQTDISFTMLNPRTDTNEADTNEADTAETLEFGDDEMPWPDWMEEPPRWRD